MAGLLGISGLAEVVARLRDADLPGTMAIVLERQAALMARAVQDGLGNSPGGGHDRPWLETGALRASIGHQADGLQAAVGSSDPAAAPQEMGTMHLPPRPFLAPVGLAMSEGVAEAVGAAVAKRLGRAGAGGHGLSDEPSPEVVNVGLGDTAVGFGGLMLGLGLLALQAHQGDGSKPGRHTDTAPANSPGPLVVEASTPVPPLKEGETPTDVLRPEGRLVGQPGTSPDIRLLPGEDDGARELFDRLTKDGGTDITPSGRDGKIVRTPTGNVIGYRPKSKSGPRP